MSSSRRGRGRGGRVRRGDRGPRRPAEAQRQPASTPGDEDESALTPSQTERAEDASTAQSAAGGPSGGSQDSGGRRRGPGGGRVRARRGRRPAQPDKTTGFRLPGWIWWVGGGGAIAGVVVIVAVLQGTSGGAQAGDHWHAALNIQVCNDSPYELPFFNGDVHSHGDGFIHLHPTSGNESGDNASLATFFRNSSEAVPSFGLTEDSITVDDIEYRDGDLCGDGSAGSLAVTINGEERADFMSYLPQEGDDISVRFR